MEQALSIEQKEALTKELNPVIESAVKLEIKTIEDSQRAQEVIKSIKQKQKRIRDFFAKMKTAAHAAWKAICDQESSYLNPLAEAESITKTKVIVFTQAEEKKRIKEANLAEAKQREAERKRQEAMEESAKKLEGKGKTEQAEALREAASQAPGLAAPPPPPAPPLASGGNSFKKIWKYEVTDLKALCQAIGSGSAPLNLILENASALNGLAKSTKGTMEVPGVRFYESTSMAVRA